MSRRILQLSWSLLLASPALAQIDLPDRPVRPPAPSPPVELTPPQRGDLARKMTGGKPEPGEPGALPELPAQLDPTGTAALPAVAGGGAPVDAPAPSTPPAALPAPSDALAAAASFILAEVRKADDVGARVVVQATPSLLNLGESGVAAARGALAEDHAPTLVVGARVLLATGAEGDAQLVLHRLRGRLPNAACGPLVDALAEIDPVRAQPELFARLLTHSQSLVRAAAQRHLAQLPPAARIEVLSVPLAARSTDARLRAVQLVSATPDPRAVELLLGRLADPSAEVARRVADALAVRSDERVPAALLQRAFDSRWILRENAYALLALMEREDLTLEPLLAPRHVDALLGGLGASDPFVSGTCAAALAGVGFRSPATAAGGWLDREVPERLVLAVSGREFHNDFSALQPTALRRLALISGAAHGTDGPRWLAWWSEAGPGFRARRAVLGATPEDAVALRVDFLSSADAGRGFRLQGPHEEAAAGAPPVPRTLYLTAAQAGELYEILRREGVFDAVRLPGSRGAAGGGAVTLEVAVRGSSKVFRFAAGAAEPWFERIVATARALEQRNRWQLYPEPGVEAGPLEAFLAEGAWWDAEHTELERDLRLKERVLRALYARPLSQRDEGVSELVELAGREGCLRPDDFEPLIALLRQENFMAGRARSLVELALACSRPSGGSPLPDEFGERLIDALHAVFGPAAAAEMVLVLKAQDRAAARAAAGDQRGLLRAVSASALAEDPDEEDLALLEELLRDPLQEVEIATLRALGHGRVVAARTEVLVRARVAESPVRAAALEAAGRLGGENVLDVLVVGLSERDSPEVAAAAARGLAILADPSTASLLVSLLSRGGDDPLAAAAREGLLALGETAWPHLLRIVNTPGSRARRDAALLLARQGVPQAAPALIRVLTDDFEDDRCAQELAVLSCVDLRLEPDPAAAWWSWWEGVVHDDSLAWLVGALERIGLAAPPTSALAGSGTAEGAVFLVAALQVEPPHLAERARRELGRLLDRDLGALPVPGPSRDAWLAALQDEIGTRAW